MDEVTHAGQQENGIKLTADEGERGASQRPPTVLGKQCLSVSMETNPERNETKRSGEGGGG